MGLSTPRSPARDFEPVAAPALLDFKSPTTATHRPNQPEGTPIGARSHLNPANPLDIRTRYGCHGARRPYRGRSETAASGIDGFMVFIESPLDSARPLTELPEV